MKFWCPECKNKWEDVDGTGSLSNPMYFTCEFCYTVYKLEYEKVYRPSENDTDQCQVCGKSIQYTGEFWRHVVRERHSAVPETKISVIDGVLTG